MNKWLLSFCLLFSSFAYADEMEKLRKAHEFCAEWEDLAGTIMEARQSGVSMKSLMELVVKPTDTKTEEHFKQAAATLIRMAFDEPRYYTEEVVDRVTNNFKNQVYSVCLQGKAENN